MPSEDWSNSREGIDLARFARPRNGEELGLIKESTSLPIGAALPWVCQDFPLQHRAEVHIGCSCPDGDTLSWWMEQQLRPRGWTWTVLSQASHLPGQRRRCKSCGHCLIPSRSSTGEGQCQWNPCALGSSGCRGAQTALAVSARVWKAMDSTLPNEPWLRSGYVRMSDGWMP